MSRKIILLLSITIGAQSFPAPKLTPCKKDDIVCQTNNAQTIYKLSVAGEPELNIERLDPMYQEKIVGDLEVIKYELTNTTLEGFKECDVVNIKLELEKSKMQFNLVCPYLIMYGLYKISGHIMPEVPIEGEGEYTVKFKDYDVTIDTDIKIIQGNDRNRYLSFKSFKVNSDLKGGMVSDLKNLFNGQKEKGDAVLKIMNENWKPVAKLLQGPAFDANVMKLVENFNRFLKYIPVSKYIIQE